MSQVVATVQANFTGNNVSLLRSINQNIDAMNRMNASLKSGSMGISQNTTVMNKGLSHTNQLLKNMAVSFAVYKIIGGVKSITESVIKLGSELELIKITFGSFTGSRAVGDNLVSQLQQLAVVTPFTTTAMLGAAKSLLAYGFGADEIVGTLKTLGDVSAGTGKDLKALAIIYGQIRTAGKLYGQDLLQLVQAGFNPLHDIAKRTGQSLEDLRKLMKSGVGVPFSEVEKAFQNATKEGGLFFNLMEKQSQTLAGRFERLKDNLQLTGQAIGTNLLEPLRGVVDLIDAAALSVKNVASGTGSLGEKFAVGGTLTTGGLVAGTVASHYINKGIDLTIKKIIGAGVMGSSGSSFTQSMNPAKLFSIREFYSRLDTDNKLNVFGKYSSKKLSNLGMTSHESISLDGRHAREISKGLIGALIKKKEMPSDAIMNVFGKTLRLTFSDITSSIKSFLGKIMKLRVGFSGSLLAITAIVAGILAFTKQIVNFYRDLMGQEPLSMFGAFKSAISSSYEAVKNFVSVIGEPLVEGVKHLYEGFLKMTSQVPLLSSAIQEMLDAWIEYSMGDESRSYSEAIQTPEQAAAKHAKNKEKFESRTATSKFINGKEVFTPLFDDVSTFLGPLVSKQFAGPLSGFSNLNDKNTKSILEHFGGVKGLFNVDEFGKIISFKSELEDSIVEYFKLLNPDIPMLSRKLQKYNTESTGLGPRTEEQTKQENLFGYGFGPQKEDFMTNIKRFNFIAKKTVENEGSSKENIKATYGSIEAYKSLSQIPKNKDLEMIRKFVGMTRDDIAHFRDNGITVTNIVPAK